MGSAALFFRLRPPRALLGDINPELVLCYEQVRAAPRSVYWHLSRLRVTPEEYYGLRAADLSDFSLPRRAARLIYLTRYCFNGIYRTNAAGRFNVPFGGALKSGQLPTLEQLEAASTRLDKVGLVCGDFEHTLAQVRANDFVYLDPPYWVRGKRRTNQYGPSTFTHKDIARLENALHDIHKKQAHFVLSYEDSDEAKQITRRWKTSHLLVRRNVAGFAAHRHTELELIATNIGIA